MTSMMQCIFVSAKGTTVHHKVVDNERRIKIQTSISKASHSKPHAFQMLNGNASFEISIVFKLHYCVHFHPFVPFYVHRKLAVFTEVKL